MPNKIIIKKRRFLERKIACLLSNTSPKNRSITNKICERLSIQRKNQIEFWEKLESFSKTHWKALLKSSSEAERIRKFLARVIAQVILIYTNEEVSNWATYYCFGKSDIFTVLQYCKSSFSNRATKEIALQLNDLSVYWDKELKDRHPNQVRRSHVFVLLDRHYYRSPRDTVPRNDGISLMLNEYPSSTTTPDKFPQNYLVFIFIDKAASPRRKLLIALHEVGHYIGCRQRNLRWMLYAHLSVMSLFSFMYRYICCYGIIHIKWGYFKPQAHDDTIYTFETRELLQSLQRFFESQYTYFYNTVFEMLNAAVADISSSSHYEYQKFIHAKVLDIMSSKRSDFLSSLKHFSLSLPPEKSAVWQPMIITSLELAFDAAVISHPNSFEKDKTDPHRGLVCPDDATSRFPDFLSNADELLAEITADIFMIKVGGIHEAKDYLELIFPEFFKCQNTFHLPRRYDAKTLFSEIYCKPPYRYRILSVLNILIVLPKDNPSKRANLFPKNLHLPCRLKRNREFLSHYEKMWRSYCFSEHSLNRSAPTSDLLNSAENRLCFNYTFNSLDIWNHQHLLSCYTQAIYNDVLYRKLDLPTLHDVVKALRTIS